MVHLKIASACVEIDYRGPGVRLKGEDELGRPLSALVRAGLPTVRVELPAAAAQPEQRQYVEYLVKNLNRCLSKRFHYASTQYSAEENDWCRADTTEDGRDPLLVRDWRVEDDQLVLKLAHPAHTAWACGKLRAILGERAWLETSVVERLWGGSPAAPSAAASSPPPPEDGGVAAEAPPPGGAETALSPSPSPQPAPAQNAALAKAYGIIFATTASAKVQAQHAVGQFALSPELVAAWCTGYQEAQPLHAPPASAGVSSGHLVRTRSRSRTCARSPSVTALPPLLATGSSAITARALTTAAAPGRAQASASTRTGTAAHAAAAPAAAHLGAPEARDEWARRLATAYAADHDELPPPWVPLAVLKAQPRETRHRDGYKRN